MRDDRKLEGLTNRHRVSPDRISGPGLGHANRIGYLRFQLDSPRRFETMECRVIRRTNRSCIHVWLDLRQGRLFISFLVLSILFVGFLLFTGKRSAENICFDLHHAFKAIGPERVADLEEQKRSGEGI